MKSQIGKLLNYILFTCLIFISLSILGAIYLMVFDKNPATVINNSPVPTNQSIYRAGDALYVTLDYCKYTDLPTTRYASFIDGIAYTLPPVDVVGGRSGCHKSNILITTIPETLPSGKYHLVVTTETEVNPLATRYTHWESQEFEVVTEIP